ncbi:MAG: glycosyltransferase family 39 protein [Bacteroidales bacterium]|nr:glycosyltransferase family 39 protein [Bacteroidales bacterium]
MKALPYLFVVGLFGLFACNNLLTRGMFMDGLIYTSVAANMAEGVGSFWHPVYTATQFPQFYEHPPLMMWLLSLWFRLFGTGMMAAKGYSVAVLLLMAALTVGVWKQLGFKTSLGWLPLLALTLIPDVALAAHNNYLESTMTLFVLAAVWLVLRGKGVGWHLLAGVMLAAAFLTKGPTGLFPLALPALLWLFGTRKGFGQAAVGTLAMAAGLAAPMALLWFCVPDAQEFLHKYFDNQVIGGSQVLVTSRTYIVKTLFSHTAVVLVVALAAVLFGILKKSVPWRPTRDSWRRFGLMFALALCGTLPMMVSTKQRAFYLLTVFPFVALAVAALLEPLARHMEKQLRRPAMTVATVAVLIAAVITNALHYGKPGRDKAMLHDMDVMAAEVHDGELVALAPELASNNSLHGYWYFYHRVTLDANAQHRHLIAADDVADTTYVEVPLPTEEYHLYRLLEE